MPFKILFFIISSVRAVYYCVLISWDIFSIPPGRFPPPIPRSRSNLAVLCPDQTLSTGVSGRGFTLWCGLCDSSQAKASLVHYNLNVILFLQCPFSFLRIFPFLYVFQTFISWTECSVLHHQLTLRSLKLDIPSQIYSHFCCVESEKTLLSWTYKTFT